MKKTFLSFLFVAAVSSASFAQVSFGPKLGLGISTLKQTKTPDGQTTTTYSSILTPQVGVVLNAQITDNFAIRPELLYLQRGAKSDLGGGATLTTRASYVELPINLVGGFQAGPGKLELFVGPSFGLALGGHYKAEGNGNSVEGSIKPKKQPEGATGNDIYMNPLNVSLNIGVDYKFDNGLLIQAGYNLGFSNSTPHYANSDQESNRNKDVTKASSINFGVAYLFGGKK
ncbi:MAG: hypothetical protein JWM14_631 [Chitinophagaceae bacterium]|nr:hypothetical protein [Chitinophagaceae bacterium]